MFDFNAIRNTELSKQASSLKAAYGYVLVKTATTKKSQYVWIYIYVWECAF